MLLRFLALSLLTGCTAVTMPGLRAASGLDPLTTPPEAIAVAVSLPNQMRLRDGDAVMRIALDGPNGPLVSETVPLTLVETPGPSGTASGDRVFVTGIEPAEAARFAAAQAEIRRLRATGIDGRGSLGVAITGGCLTAPLGDTLPVATWLRPGPDADFVLLTHRSDFLSSLDAETRAALRNGLAPCP
ncbi:MAG: hypothetical protein AAGF30_00895 [Pseudomonadota bacterium]